MTEAKTRTASVDFRELEPFELERVSGGYSLDEVMLNPQPLPPRVLRYFSSFSRVALNPQPEPPGSQLSRVMVF